MIGLCFQQDGNMINNIILAVKNHKASWPLVVNWKPTIVKTMAEE